MVLPTVSGELAVGGNTGAGVCIQAVRKMATIKVQGDRIIEAAFL
jgi:hypothetical protein